MPDDKKIQKFTVDDILLRADSTKKKIAANRAAVVDTVRLKRDMATDAEKARWLTVLNDEGGEGEEPKYPDAAPRLAARKDSLARARKGELPAKGK